MARKSRAPAAPPPGAESNFRTVARNRRATYDYEILDRFEAGLVLSGSEIKSLRQGKGSIQEAYVRPRHGELWLIGATIPRYEAATHDGHDPGRDRKLLLHRKQIRQVEQAVEEKGLTAVPIHLFIARGLAKLEIGIARGKRQFDKRQTLARREAERRIRQAVRT